MTSPSPTRKRRGIKTQALAAAHLAVNGWPYATDAGPGRPGRDVLGVPGLAIEVKARADLSPMAWLRQAAKAADGDVPVCVFRPNGMGETCVGQWGVFLAFDDFIRLARAAGYGDPLDAEGAA